MSEDFGDVYFGTEKANDADWRSGHDPDEIDDEELAETPADVIGMLGFDPREFSVGKKMGLAAVVKHLSGKHDQETHGGDRGNLEQEENLRDLIKGMSNKDIAYLISTHEFYESQLGFSENRAVDNKIDSQARLLERLKDNNDFDDFVFSEYETNFVTDDLRRHAIKDLVDNWAKTSGDHDKVSIAIQMAVEKEFGLSGGKVPLRDYRWKASQEEDKSFLEKDVKEYFSKNEKGLRAFVRAEYEETQEYLSRSGIDKMLVWRGVGESAQEGMTNSDFEKGYAFRRLATMPISSFSSSKNIAIDFTEEKEMEDRTVVMAIVPAKRIFSTPKSGVGCTYEREVVILGGEIDAVVIPLGPSSVSLFTAPPRTTLEKIRAKEKK